MYLSYLQAALGPDWSNDFYAAHQRIWSAFPDVRTMLDDPFCPEEIKAQSRFLFRVEPPSALARLVVVQSRQKPDWDHAFKNAPHCLRAAPLVKDFNPQFPADTRLRFRLRANATTYADTPRGRKRVGIKNPDELRNWLAGKSKAGGYEVEDVTVTTEMPKMSRKVSFAGGAPRNHDITLSSTLFEGRLKVTDSQAFAATLTNGIGRGKGLGFGLLSVK